MKRPTFLTVWLVLMAIGAAFSVFSYTLGSAALKVVYPNMQSWVIVAYTIGSIVNAVAVTMLWMWKKQGFI